MEATHSNILLFTVSTMQQPGLWAAYKVADGQRVQVQERITTANMRPNMQH